MIGSFLDCQLIGWGPLSGCRSILRSGYGYEIFHHHHQNHREESWSKLSTIGFFLGDHLSDLWDPNSYPSLFFWIFIKNSTDFFGRFPRFKCWGKSPESHIWFLRCCSINPWWNSWNSWWAPHANALAYPTTQLSSYVKVSYPV